MNDKTFETPDHLFRSTGNWQIKFIHFKRSEFRRELKSIVFFASCTGKHCFVPCHHSALQNTHLKRLFSFRVTDQLCEGLLLLVLLVLLRIIFRLLFLFLIFIPGKGGVERNLVGPAQRPINSWLTVSSAQVNGLNLRAGEGNRTASCGQDFSHAAVVYKTHAYLCDLWDLTGSPGIKFSSLRSNFTGSSRFTGWQSKSQAKCQSQQHLFQTKKNDFAGKLKQTTVQTGTSRTVVGDSVGLPETLEFGSGEEAFSENAQVCRISCLWWINTLPICPCRGSNFHFDRLAPWLCSVLTIAGLCIGQSDNQSLLALFMQLPLNTFNKPGSRAL